MTAHVIAFPAGINGMRERLAELDHDLGELDYLRGVIHDERTNLAGLLESYGHTIDDTATAVSSHQPRLFGAPS